MTSYTPKQRGVIGGFGVVAATALTIGIVAVGLGTPDAPDEPAPTVTVTTTQVQTQTVTPSPAPPTRFLTVTAYPEASATVTVSADQACKDAANLAMQMYVHFATWSNNADDTQAALREARLGLASQDYERMNKGIKALETEENEQSADLAALVKLKPELEKANQACNR